MLQSTLSGSSVPGLGGRERVIWRYGLVRVLYDYEVRAYTAARTACIRGKIDTIRESMPGNSNSPQVPRRGPRMSPGTRRYQLRYPTVLVLTRGRLHTCIDRCNSQHAPGPPPPVLAYAMTPLHGRSDDVTDSSKLTLTIGTRPVLPLRQESVEQLRTHRMCLGAPHSCIGAPYDPSSK